jgi:autoinducer 2 (AI-2) kinase
LSSQLLLALDAGTGSCRAILFDDRGQERGSAQREWSHTALDGIVGSQDFNTDLNWRLICECVREVIDRSQARPDDVRAVSAASMREGMVLYDSEGRELWACPNVDSRACIEAEELVRNGDAQRIYDIAGDWVAITAPARFRWIARHQPDVLAATAHVGMLADWIVTRLSGEFTTDPSLGSSSGMFDLSSRNWSDEILELCELDRSIFPPVTESGTIVGNVSATASSATGLLAGTPVVVGGADTQLGLAGIGVVDGGRFTVVGGSFWQTTIVSDKPLIDPGTRLRTLCHTVPDRWMTEGIGFYSGLTARWFRDAFCQEERDRGRRDGVDVYEQLEAAAAGVPAGANGVVGIFSNVMDAKRWVHASPSFLGFDIANPSTSGKKECFRAIEEAAAYAAEGHRLVIEELIEADVSEGVLTGGAAKGTLWPQIVADVLGIPIGIPRVKESTALGAALYAGVGCGVFGSLDEVLGDVVSMERIVEPDERSHEIYAELFSSWLDVYRMSLDMSEKTGVRPLWRAAGA